MTLARIKSKSVPTKMHKGKMHENTNVPNRIHGRGKHQPASNTARRRSYTMMRPGNETRISRTTSSSPDIRSDTCNEQNSVRGGEELGGFSSNNSHYDNNSGEDDFEEEYSEEDSYVDGTMNEEMGQVSSDSSPDMSMTKKRHPNISERFHNDAAKREKDRVFQRKLYNNNKGFPKSVDVERQIKRVMKEKVYPRLKILSDTESQFLHPDFVGKPVDQSRVICEILSQELELYDALEIKVKFWITYRSLVKNQLVKYRSNCVEDLKREYFRVKELLALESASDEKNSAYLEGCEQLLSLLSKAGDDHNCSVISLRNDNTKLAFFFFAREFLPCVVKRLVFRQKKLQHQLSEFVTVSDEAFTLLLLENNVARWNAMFAEGTNKSHDQMPPQKFQSAVVTRNDDKNIARKNNKIGKDGYGLQAVCRYNEYYQEIEQARNNIDTESLEKELMARIEDLDDGGSSRNRKLKRKRDGELNYVDENGAPVRARCELLDLY